jgi:Flp pilus assembly protein TadD
MNGEVESGESVGRQADVCTCLCPSLCRNNAISPCFLPRLRPGSGTVTPDSLDDARGAQYANAPNHANALLENALTDSRFTHHRMSRGPKSRRAPHGAGMGNDDVQPDSRTNLQIPLICILLAFATLLVFRQTGEFDFVNYDDDTNVYLNPLVKDGLTIPGISEAFTKTRIGHWVPLTTVSHMLDCQLYGMKAGGHHLTNVLLHTTSAILLFLVLTKMTSSVWPSAFVAAVFAVHPLRVESVVWVTERKDVLSGLFFMLTIGAYIRYAERPQSLARYLMVVLFFACGLMSKSMLVTLPFVLLLLDYWPLRRFGLKAAVPAGGPHVEPTPIPRLIGEKLPLLALSFLVCLVTLRADTGAIVSLEKLPLLPRIANALVSYATYVWQIFCPANLAVFYPHPRSGLPLREILGSGAVLLAISAVAIVLRRKQPWFIVGWLWYLGMLVPVIGIVQSGDLARADRYTYLPHIGLYLLVTWTATNSRHFPRPGNRGAGAVAAILVALLALASRRQTAHWEDSESLWRHTMTCTRDNYIAHHNYGAFLAERGRVEEAHHQFQEALRVKPDYSDALSNLGNLLARTGRFTEAIDHFQAALKILPNDWRLHRNLGIAFLRAERHEEAITQLRKALQNEPGSAEVHTNLGIALEKTGNHVEAIQHYERSLAIDGKAPAAHVNLAWILATCPDASARDGHRAIKLAQRAGGLSHGKEPLVFDALAAAYAESGQFPQALENGERALKLAIDLEIEVLADAIRERLKLYKAGAPFRDLPKKGVGNP